MMTRRSLLGSCLLLLASPLAAMAQDIPAGPWAGDWIANPTKSHFPGTAPKVDQVTIQPDGTTAIHVVDHDGKTSDWSYKPQVGQAEPIQGRDNVTVKIVKVNAHRIDQTWNNKGKITHTHSILSRDGKTQTFYGAPEMRDGRRVREIVVYEKQ